MTLYFKYTVQNESNQYRATTEHTGQFLAQSWDVRMLSLKMILVEMSPTSWLIVAHDTMRHSGSG